MGIGQYGNYVLNGAIYSLTYDLLNDFEPVALVASNPQAIVVKNDLPVKTLKELVAYLAANPGKATEGTAGAGSPSHVSGIYLQNVTGTRFTFRALSGCCAGDAGSRRGPDRLHDRPGLELDPAGARRPHPRAGP